MTVATPHGSYLTGDDLAVATVRTSTELARRHEVELIQLPFVDESGAVAQAMIPIGWGCHIAARSAPGYEDLVDFDAVAAIRQAGRHELNLKGAAFSAEEVHSTDWVLD